MSETRYKFYTPKIKRTYALTLEMIQEQKEFWRNNQKEIEKNSNVLNKEKPVLKEEKEVFKHKL